MNENLLRIAMNDFTLEKTDFPELKIFRKNNIGIYVNVSTGKEGYVTHVYFIPWTSINYIEFMEK